MKKTIAIILVTCAIFAVICTWLDRVSTVVDQNVTTCEATVTHADITRSSHAGTTYQLSVANGDEFSTVIEVSPEMYAKYKVGDPISITVSETRYKSGDVITDYGIS